MVIDDVNPIEIVEVGFEIPFVLRLEKVLEPSLLFEPVFNGEFFLRLIGELPLTINNLIQGPVAGLYRKLAQFYRVVALGAPAPVAWCQNIQEGRTRRSPLHRC